MKIILNIIVFPSVGTLFPKLGFMICIKNTLLKYVNKEMTLIFFHLPSRKLFYIFNLFPLIPYATCCISTLFALKKERKRKKKLKPFSVFFLHFCFDLNFNLKINKEN